MAGPEDSAEAFGCGVIGGIVCIVAGAVLTLTGAGAALGLPLMFLGGWVLFQGGAFLTDKAVKSDAGKAAAATAKQVARSVSTETEKARLRKRAERVAAQLSEQAAAGAISAAECDQKLRSVNEKLLSDMARIDARQGE
ncbi:MAG TPA: hypothetical protein VGK50_02110 [Coriobacteriia bacterium]|jgi:hypothetical protein